MFTQPNVAVILVSKKQELIANSFQNRFERNFSVAAANRLWVADITYISTLAGVLYLGVVLDVFSRRVIGWAMAAHIVRVFLLPWNVNWWTG